MKTLTFYPRLVVATGAALAVVVIVVLIASIGVGRWKWSDSRSPSVPQTQFALAEPAASPSAATPDAVASSATASADPVSRLVESQASKVVPAEVNQPKANVAERVASGFFSPVLAQEAVSLPAATPIDLGKTTLAVMAVKPMPSLQKATDAAGKTLSLGRSVEALDGQLIDRVNATRKFEIVSRSDLKPILDEQGFGTSGNVDSKTAAQIGKLTGAKYLLVTSVDDFADFSESATFPGTGKSATKRLIRLSAVGKIWDSSTGKLLESVNFQHSVKDTYEERPNTTKDGKLTDELLLTISREMAEKIAVRVADTIFPVKVLAKRDKQITINRGDGSGVEVDQIWQVFAVGQDLIDPDTKEVLGKEEVLIGKAQIKSVTPKFSTAELLEDNGVDKGAILRLPPAKKNP